MTDAERDHCRQVRVPQSSKADHGLEIHVLDHGEHFVVEYRGKTKECATWEAAIAAAEGMAEDE